MNKKKRGTTIIALLIVSVLCICGITVVANHYFGKPERADESETVLAEDELSYLSETESSLEEIVLDSTETESDEALVNILLVGQDRREGEDRQRSDSMILLSMNPETNELSMISFLRDLYVQIPGYTDNRLNAAYAFGGFSLLKDTLYTNFGITVDGCIEVDFNGFKDIIDFVGGVDVELTEAEAEIVGDGAVAGLNHLDGEHALIYVRIRKLDSDFGRTERQRKVLNAVFSKLKGTEMVELLGLVNDCLPIISTDMSDEEITSVAIQYAPALANLEISMYHVPENGFYKNATVRGMDVLIPDLAKIKKAIFEEYYTL